MTTRLVQRTLTGGVAVVKCGKCDKICKNLRGLRIHQARTDCGKSDTQTQRSGVTPGETLEDPSREEYHRGTSTLLRVWFQTPRAGFRKRTTMTLFLICFSHWTMTLQNMQNQHHKHKQLREMMRRGARG
ncbi:hypothetical protein DPMN_079596 [Dreissena polymorpha]|uniref:Uncharacterized protein n=1 Tax=Dreissena polymorpha TaxID=45954 RepID=A0A9D3YTE3_DREPO|nr:hypothetical protein DPMN_079596 [Dreissena polymorpha]